MENRKKEILIITLVLVLQTMIYVFCGVHKSYIHMDEAYSLGLASYDKVEIQDNQDFYNTWHNNEYYEDYLTVNDDEVGKYSQVYENQKNDVHPPLYYLFLRFSMGFSKNSYSKWSGIVINIIIFMAITVVMYNILQKLLKGENKSKEKSIILAFISSITMASLTNAIYIRMYALSTLNILITTFLHMKLLEEEKIRPKLLVLIGLSALIGSLTHYYFLFYLAMMYLIFAIKYIRKKDLRSFWFYTLTMGVAAITSLAIFPYSIQHMFFGYRGQGVISKLLNVPAFLKSIWEYILKIDRFAFNHALLLIIVIMITGLIYKKKNKQETKREKTAYMKILILPTLFYTFLVAVSSPWVELRYIMPVCSLIFVIVLYYLYKLLNTILSEKKSNTIFVIILIAIMISPAIFKIEPEVMFSDKKEIVQKLGNELNVPTIYLFNSQNNRFLDDILLFSEINESYIAKDIDCTTENINTILEGKDISKGIVIFINEGQENDDLLAVISNATGLKNTQYLKRLNACDVYYIK